MRVAILGARGMLGNQVARALDHMGIRNTPFTRDGFSVNGPSDDYVVNTKLNKLDRENWDRFDFLVNCIGAIKPTFNANTSNAIYTNAILPRQIANWGHVVGCKVIHITTDCVFDGRDGPYDETREHNATDEYGKSKSLGEPTNCLVLRTSIIGPEVDGKKRSLYEWVRSQSGGRVSGFMNHWWNGVTTYELGKIIGKIIKKDLWQMGTFHVFSEDVTKAALVRSIAKSLEIPLEIDYVDAPSKCDRRLRTKRHLQELVQPQGLDKMLEELRNV